MSSDEKRTVSPDLNVDPQAVVSVPVPSLSSSQLSYKAEDILYEIGYGVDDDLTDISLVDIIAVPGGGPNIVKEIFNFRQTNLNNNLSHRFSSGDEKRIQEAILKGMRVRAQNVLLNLAPQTVVDFIKIPWSTIIGARSCGRETFDQILAVQNRVREILIQLPNRTADEVIRHIESLTNGDNHQAL